MSVARELRGKLEAQAEAAQGATEFLVRDIAQELECSPQGLATLAGVRDGQELPEMDGLDASRQSQGGPRKARWR